MGYKQLDFRKRCQIYGLKRAGHSYTKIAKEIGVHKSTISRELNRNITFYLRLYMWELSQEFINAFPSYLKEDILYIEKHIKSKSNSSFDELYGVRGGSFSVIVNNKELTIPQRHNLKEIQQQNIFDRILKKEIILNDTQKTIIDCFYTRHCDGFIREKHCKNIIQLKHEWIVPYIFLLIGEYVIEILDVIHSNLDQMDLSIYREFIQNNEKFYELTKQRVQSYWNCYYRWKYPKKEDYPGFKILDLFDKKVVAVIS